MNIAIVSPSKNAYSETFIQAHKNHLKGSIFYYYDGEIPLTLEGKGVLLNKFYKLKYFILNFFQNQKYSLPEQAVMTSFKENKIDVVLAEYGVTGAKLVNICKKLKTPLVVHFHGYDACKRDVINSYKEMYLKMFDYSYKIISVSNVMTKDLLSIGCPIEKIIYNVYGPNDLFLDVKKNNVNQKQFIAVGRFTEKKAPQITIKAFSMVLEKHTEATLLMAGNGKLLDSCKSLVSELGIDKSVTFLGVIKKEEFVNYLSSSLAMVQHSVTAKSGDKEGTPLAILESSAAGLPVISTYHAGIPDVIIHRETGLLCDEKDVNQMAKHMIELLDNPELAKQMGIKGKENITNNFNLTRHINILNDILKNSICNA